MTLALLNTVKGSFLQATVVLLNGIAEDRMALGGDAQRHSSISLIEVQGKSSPYPKDTQ
jgi:hypothetical protein